MDHHAVLAHLSAQEKAALTRRSDLAGLRHLALYLGCLTLTSVWIGVQAPLWGLALLPQGLLIVSLFTLCHECTHQTPFRTPWMNEAVGHASGLLLLLPFQWFRYFHLAHHRHTNDHENDPELASPRPDTWGQYVWHVTGLPYWGAMIRVLGQNGFGQPQAPYLPPRTLPRLRREARAYLAIYAAVLLSLLVSPIAASIWIVPALIGQPFLRLYLLAEHGRCPPVANMLENTRTTLTNRILRFLAWNMPYHIEHHSFPAVPFHALPRLHEHMQNDLVTTAPGYAAFTREYVGGLGQSSNNGI
jgi:fatty acid desaturase